MYLVGMDDIDDGLMEPPTLREVAPERPDWTIQEHRPRRLSSSSKSDIPTMPLELPTHNACGQDSSSGPYSSVVTPLCWDGESSSVSIGAGELGTMRSSSMILLVLRQLMRLYAGEQVLQLRMIFQRWVIIRQFPRQLIFVLISNTATWGTH